MKENIKTEKQLKHVINDMWTLWPRDVPFVVEFYKKPETRSKNQNKTYWKWISFVCGEWGYLNTERWRKYVSTWLKRKVDYVEEIEIQGEKQIVVKSTKGDKAVVAKFMNKLQLYLSEEHSINVPLPADKEFEKFCEYYEKFIK